MGKIKLIVKLLLVSSLFSLGLSAKTAHAIAPMVSVTQLEEYINSNSFKLSYSALSDNPGAITAQFYVQKEGGSYLAFGPLLAGASGQVQVTGSQVNDQVDYCFKVEIDSAAASDETCTSYDFSGPSPVQNYWKEKVAPGFYRLHWENPWDTDLSRIFIYRSETASFDADNSHKVGEAGGTYDMEMTWDNVGLDSGKEYYYALRAVDKAENSSSLVGDSETVEQTENVSAESSQSQAESEVSTLPEEGEVLAEATEAPTPTSTSKGVQNAAGEASEGPLSPKVIVLIAIGALALASGLFYLARRK